MKKTATTRLPDWASEGAVVVEWLHAHGVLDGIGERLRIQREGGYVGLDLVLFLLFFLTQKLDGGIKGFGERARPHTRQLGALGDRRRLPAPPSVSRILAATASEHTETLSEWLLLEACSGATLLAHPSVAALDAVGKGWHVFDLDPTNEVLRQRALPDFDDLPPARRRTVEARRGYTGRKRGDVQLSRMTLQHAGSGLYLGLWMAPGNGEWREHSEAAVRRVRDVCDRMGESASRALVRVDGAGGNVPFIATCQEARVHVLTRWHQYEVLDEPAVRTHLNAASWFAVADSGSGPRREAAEIGWLTLHAAEGSTRADGSPWGPVRCRIVVSRFRARDPEKKRGAGTLIEGWQYEMYATDLPVDGWPANDVVTAYYGRCGQENRFYQEDQELGLDRILSYHIPGQQLANLVGLFLWNLRTCRGFELSSVPAELPAQPARVATPVDASTSLTIAAPRPPSDAEVDAVGVATPVVADPVAPAPEALAPEIAVMAEPPLATIDPPAAAAPLDALPASRAEVRGALESALSALNWTHELREKPGWRWDAHVGLVCPSGLPNTLRSVKIHGLDTTRQFRFLAPYGACAGCVLRAGCSDSGSDSYRKETTIRVPTPIAYPIHRLFERLHGRPEPSVPAPRPAPAPRRTPAARPTPAPRRQRAPEEPRAPGNACRPPTTITQDPAIPGPLAVTPAILLPARLRGTFVRGASAVAVEVQVDPPRERPRVLVFALTAAERQSRRLTWAERHRWNALPDEAHVHVVFAGGDEVLAVPRGAASPLRRSAG